MGTDSNRVWNKYLYRSTTFTDKERRGIIQTERFVALFYAVVYYIIGGIIHTTLDIRDWSLWFKIICPIVYIITLTQQTENLPVWRVFRKLKKRIWPRRY